MTALAVEHLTKRYGPVAAVNDVSFEVPEGQLLALLGPNGAGKTTTMDMVLGLTRPDAGRVTLFGKSPARAIAAGTVGGMLQTGAVIEYLSVRELITMVASLYPHPLPVNDVLDLVGIAELADHRTNKLSGGQAQRVRFALALIGDTDLLMLDEPTAALDVESRRDFWATMRAKATQGKTVIFATHYLEEADANADRIILIARGRVVADGSPAEIRATVSWRTIQATLPDADPAQLAALPGVTKVERRGDAVILSCADSDSALWELHHQFPDAHDIEVRGMGIEDAFLALTDDHITGPQQAIS